MILFPSCSHVVFPMSLSLSIALIICQKEPYEIGLVGSLGAYDVVKLSKKSGKNLLVNYPPWAVVSPIVCPWCSQDVPTIEISPTISHHFKSRKIQSWVFLFYTIPRMRENKLLRRQGDLCIMKVSYGLNFHFSGHNFN